MNRLLTTEDEVRPVAARFAKAGPRIGLDAEGDGFFRYQAKLCTLQLSSTDEIAIVDALAVPARTLEPALGSGGPEKVVHDAAFDVRLLRDAGVRLEPIFDTSIAARFLGETATGLASLAKKLLDVTVSKEQQQADWGARPLDDELVLYLEDDVRHLLALAEVLEGRVREAAIELEVREECAWVISSAMTEVPEERPPWARIKSALELAPMALSILREAALVREERAKALDLAPFRIAPNAALIDVAKARPKSMNEVARIRGLSRGHGRSIAADLADAVRRGEARGKLPPDEEARVRGEAPPREVRDARRKRKEVLTSWRRDEAKRRGVDPQVVLPGHCVAALSEAEVGGTEELAAIPGFGAFRVERYGAALLGVLSGSPAPAI